MDARFQVCFTPLAAVLFAFPSRYWFAIGHQVVFSLGGWSPRIRAEFHVLRPNWDSGRTGNRPSAKGLSPAVAPLSSGFAWPSRFHVPVPQPRGASSPVWAPALSLATTRGISFDFSSSGYLDVSLPRVWLRRAMDSPAGGAPLRAPGCPIRIPADQCPLTAPRSLSQSSASFIAS